MDVDYHELPLRQDQIVFVDTKEMVNLTLRFLIVKYYLPRLTQTFEFVNGSDSAKEHGIFFKCLHETAGEPKPVLTLPNLNY
jgi:hypothetical protein